MKHLRLVLVLLLCTALFVSPACTVSPNGSETSSDTAPLDISALADMLTALRDDYRRADEEKQQQIDELRQRLEQSTAPVPEQTEPPQKGSFRYEAVEGGICLTAYVGSDPHVVIPYAIDGMRVLSIGSYAFRSVPVQSVTVCEGVQALDWFALAQCPSLSAVTLPSSLVSIGYGAFDGCSAELCVYAPRDSFALSFCQSFGLTYSAL